MYVNLVLVIIDIMPRLYFCRKYYSLSISKFLYEVLLKTWTIALVCYIVGSFIVSLVNYNQTSFGLFLSISLLLIMVILVISLVGVSREERTIILTYIKNKRL